MRTSLNFHPIVFLLGWLVPFDETIAYAEIRANRTMVRKICKKLVSTFQHKLSRSRLSAAFDQKFEMTTIRENLQKFSFYYFVEPFWMQCFLVIGDVLP